MAGVPTAEAFMDLHLEVNKDDVEKGLDKVDTKKSGRKGGKDYGVEFGKAAAPTIKEQLGKLLDKSSPGVGALRKQLDDLAKQTVRLHATIDDKGAQSRLLSIATQIDKLSAKTADPKITLQGQLKAESSILAMSAALDKLGGKTARPNVKLEGADTAVAQAAGLGGTLGKLGKFALPALIGAGVTLAPVLLAVGAGLGGVALASISVIKNSALMGRILAPIKTQFAGFSSSLRPEVITLFGQAIGIAGTFLKGIQPIAVATAHALGGLLGSVDAVFRGGSWQQFFQFMAAQAGPDVKLLGSVITDLLLLIPPLATSLQPLARGLLLVVDGTLKAITALAKLHLLLPVIGAAIGLIVGGPIGALIGGLAGIAVEGLAAAESTQKAADGLAALAKVRNIDLAASVNWKAVAVNVNGLLKNQADGYNAVTLAMLLAHPKLGTIIGDIAILNVHMQSGNALMAAWNNLWAIFVGRSVADQEAILNITAAFEGYNSTVKQSGKTSTAAQQAFLAIFDALGSGLSTLEQNGASVKQINSFYADNIGKLNALHGLTPIQRKDIQGLTQDYAAWASSVHGLSGNLVNASNDISLDFLGALGSLHKLVPTAGFDTRALAAAILKTGTNSAATAIDRHKLIQDLEHSGISAKNAASLVNSFQGQINNLRGKTVNVGLTTSGKGQIIITGTGINTRTINTSTGTLRGPGGHTIAKGAFINTGAGPTIDDFPAMLARGELVVPARLVAAGLVNHLRGMIPGFAGGGVVGRVSGAEDAISSADVTVGSAAAIAFAQAAIKAAQVLQSGFLGPGSGNYAADIQTVLRAMGLPLSLTANWLSQIQTESGGNLRAVNLTDSNAQAGHPSVGLLQLIPGTFAAYAGPYLHTPPLVNFGGGFVSEDAMAQIYSGIHYANARYGSSMGAVIGHGHGYHDGGPITEPIFGIGPSGTGYTFEAGESVLSAGAGNQIIALLAALLAELRAQPGKIAGGVSKAVTAPRGMEAQAARLGAR